jgi:putative ABC transport system permease protein
VYRPFAQQPWRSLFLVARTSADPTALAAELRGEIAAVDRDITVSDVSTLDAVLVDATARPRLRTRLLAAFAFAAVVIAGIGLYGVIAYSVSQRSGELAIRVALGADAGSIRRLVIAEGLMLVGIGGAAGLLAAAGLARLVGSLLYGITPADPASYALAATGVALCGLVASYVPAARASRTDPLSVLRAE